MRYIYSFKKFLMNEEIEYSGDDGFDLLNKFLMKLDVTTTKLKSNLIFDFYRKVVTSKYLPNLEKEVSYITQVLMLLRSGANNKDEKKVVDNLKKIKSVLLIDDDGKSPWISDNNIKLHLSKSDARKIGDLHSELLRIMKYFEVINLYSTKNKPEIQSIPKKEPIKKTEKSADIWIEKELDSGTKETNLGEIKSKIKIEPRHQIILDMMPDYSNIKASIVNPVGGLGYVGNFKEREINRGKAISTTILFDGLPTSEIFTHELLHYFTIPVLVRYTENPADFKGSDVETYVTSLMSLAKQVQSNGYSAVNGVSVHNNLNEFAVNITNQDSCNKLKAIKVSTTYGKSTTAYDMLMKITSDYLKSLSNKQAN